MADVNGVLERVLGRVKLIETDVSALKTKENPLIWDSAGNVGLGSNILNRAPERLLSVMGAIGTATVHVGSYGGVNGDSDTYLWSGYPGVSFQGGGVGYNWRQQDGGSMARNNASYGGAYLQLLSNSLSLNTVDTSGVSRQVFHASNGNAAIGIAAQSTWRFGVQGVDASTGSYAFVARNSTPANLMYLRNDGQTWANQAWTISDRRAKKNITSSPYGLAQLRAALPHKYKLKLNDSDQLGFMADELQAVFPELVTPASHCITCEKFLEEHENADHAFDPTLSVNYTGLIAVLWRAVQELDTQVQALDKGKVK
jgi:hypothetical protein